MRCPSANAVLLLVCVSKGRMHDESLLRKFDDKSYTNAYRQSDPTTVELADTEVAVP